MYPYITAATAALLVSLPFLADHVQRPSSHGLSGAMNLPLLSNFTFFQLFQFHLIGHFPPKSTQKVRKGEQHLSKH